MSTVIGSSIEQTDATTQRRRLLVAMRDGVELATDVYWPSGVRLEQLVPRPALLERTPYGIRATRSSDGRHADGTQVTPESGAQFFVQRGYVVVRQDCRGRGDSDGVFTKYVSEAEDGVDTHRWLAGQHWCDGRIATHGASYSAHTQAASASLSAPNLVAMILDSGGFSSAWDAGGRFGGAFELKQAIWAYRRALSEGDFRGETRPVATERGLRALSDWLTLLPWRRGFSPLSGTPNYEDFVFEQWEHEDLDTFWTQPGLYARGYYQCFPAVPVLNVCSWYDPYVLSAIENFQALRQRHELTCLLLGPWTHGARSLSYAGDVDFGPSAVLDGNIDVDYLSFKARWLDGALGSHPISHEPVTYFLMGGGSGKRTDNGRMLHGGRWLTSNQWPPDHAVEYLLYLTDAQGLAEQPPVARSEITYNFDPRNPVPSLGGGIASSEPLMFGGAFDQRFTTSTASLPVSARRDVVTFQTAPLARSVIVVGSPALEVQFSSSAPDTDVTVKLIDVYPPSVDYPDGFAMNLTDGMLRCRYRDDPRQPELMKPGELYAFTISMPDTANLFQAGHRIRVDVSSSNFPRCDVNPNTGRLVMGDRTWQVATNTLHIGHSRLRLLVLPR